MEFFAFYLPQYHPIPENDAVYGAGFTEWDNVLKARPLFPGHYQPHVPHKMIGCYDLRNEKFLCYQHDLAYSFGITGFCYYYYNFSGKTLLERPLQIIRNNNSIKNRYCLCWAHPSWYDNTKGPQAIFVRQEYSQSLARLLFSQIRIYLEDKRYLTINGRPCLLIWAPERNPLMRIYAEILKEESLRQGFGELFLAGVEAYGPASPSQFAFDAMVEFAPNWREENHVSLPGERPVQIDYKKTLNFMTHKEIPPYPRIRCTFPAWDNTPRRGLDGIACTGIDPRAFAHTLNYLVEYTKIVLPPSLQYVFLNAWNEWGEGCHLEPDRKYNLYYLEIVKKAAERAYPS
ncbi:MAG: glycoside hydrolase family 99-like domain-containing protein [Desulfovibrio sp.]|nr:glycoside hydrolase family 99-like domain-containing protein [Desulfovibrio sp.]